MDSRQQLIQSLLDAYQSLDDAKMASCYHESATFSDIAFRLQGRKQIHAMWHMICESGIKVEVESVETHGDSVRAKIVDTYKFSDTGRTVVNPITCRFQFREGLIIQHDDQCDALAWARQAFGGLKGEIVGRLGFLRRIAAKRKLKAHIAKNPQFA